MSPLFRRTEPERASAHEAHDHLQLADALRGGDYAKWLFFHGDQGEPDGSLGPGCLSQWWPAAFTLDGITYPSAEHMMAASKARLFGDRQTEALILKAPTAAEAHRLGHQVRGFDEYTWSGHRAGIAYAAVGCKFGRNPQLADYLASTGTRVLVDADPDDQVWGNGLAPDDPRATDPAAWPGINLLGFTLMQVRSRLA
jgi:ribA/ribD-fused uncharacterized protein